MVGVVLKISKKSLSGLAQVEVDELPQCLAAVNIGLCNTISFKEILQKKEEKTIFLLSLRCIAVLEPTDGE